jgi:hypothetical protein
MLMRNNNLEIWKEYKIEPQSRVIGSGRITFVFSTFLIDHDKMNVG